MQRIGRNARWLAQRLQAHIDAEPAGACEKVVHASLAAHPAHRWAMRLAFQGGSLVLVLRPPYRLVEAYQRFLALALGEARDAGVDLVIGSSFGFDTTRLYLTTPFAGPFSEPYLRISAGTESMLELQQLGDVLVRAMQRMARLKPADFASDAVSRAVMQWDSLRKAPLGKWHGSSAT